MIIQVRVSEDPGRPIPLIKEDLLSWAHIGWNTVITWNIHAMASELLISIGLFFKKCLGPSGISVDYASRLPLTKFLKLGNMP